MFDFIKKKRNFDLVKKIVIDNIFYYSDIVKQNLENMEDVESDEALDKIMLKLRKDYFNIIREKVLNNMETSKKQKFIEFENSNGGWVAHPPL